MKHLLAKLPPSIVALLLQFSAALLLVLSLPFLGLHVTPLVFAMLCGILAALLSAAVGLARWWLPIQLIFAPAMVLLQTFNIPSGYFLAAFLVMLVVYWSTFRTQVPLYLSSQKVWQALETRLPDTPFRFVDLGSGLGGVLTHLAKTHPHGQFHGVESAPLPFLWSWLRIKLGRYRNCSVSWSSLWHCPLAEYEVVFAYLSPVPMPDLWKKAQQEMHPGSLFISNTFSVPGQPPHETLTVDDLHHSELCVWRI